MNSNSYYENIINEQVNITASLYDLFGSDTESAESCNYLLIARIIGTSNDKLARNLRLLKGLGLHSARYGNAGKGKRGHTGGGKTSYWTFKGAKKDALDSVRSYFESRYADRLGKVEKKVETLKPVTVAISGPDPDVNPFEILRPLRKADDAEALIKAAQQYSDRLNFMEKKLKELADAGILVDRSAVHVDKDERLETVSLLLPFINRLENTVRALGEKAALVEKTTNENIKLKAQVERLVAERVNGG